MVGIAQSGLILTSNRGLRDRCGIDTSSSILPLLVAVSSRGVGAAHTMSLIFKALHTLGSGAETRPRRRLDTAPRRPPSDPMPRPSGGAPALATVSTRAGAGATMLLHSSPCL